MKHWRNIARTAGSCAGPVFTVLWLAVTSIQARQPMSVLEWVAVALISAPTVYGVAELAHFLRRLRRDVDALRMLRIEGRLATMEDWWKNPNSTYLSSMRIVRSEEK
jgi:hypothetical protein